MNSVIIKDEAIIEQQNNVIDFEQIDSDKARACLMQIFQFLDNSEMLLNVKKEERYYLDLPKELSEMIQNGEAWFTKKSSNGDTLAQLRHISKDGKEVIYKIPTVKKEDFQCPNETGNPMNELFLMSIQKDVAAIADSIEEAKLLLDEVKTDIQNNTLSKIDSAYEQLLIADSMKNPLQRIQSISHAIQSLSEGNAEVYKAIEARLDKFEGCPSDKFKLYLKMLKSKDYIADVEGKIDELDKLFNYYDKGIKLHVMACAMLNEPDALEKVRMLYQSKVLGLNYANIKTISEIFQDETLNDEWYINPEGYVELIESQCEVLKLNCNGGMTLSISGNQIQEALTNEKRKEEKCSSS